VRKGDQFDNYIDWFFGAGVRLRAALSTEIVALAASSPVGVAEIP
jgi:hypothetical protein